MTLRFVGRREGRRLNARFRGRDYATTDDVKALAKDALRHRLVLSYQALAEGVTPDAILDQVRRTAT